MKRNLDDTRTLGDLVRAWGAGKPVTITYTKADGSETVRTIETYDVEVSRDGRILLVVMDRETRERRSFRLDRITFYTVHHGSSYVVPLAEDADVLGFDGPWWDIEAPADPFDMDPVQGDAAWAAALALSIRA